MSSNQSSFHRMKERNTRNSYQGFHTQRQYNSQTINEHLDDLQIKGLVREFHIKYPVQTLLNHFKRIFNQMFLLSLCRGFKITEVFPGKIMLVKLGLFDRLKFIIWFKQPTRYLLSVKTQQYKSVRKVLIKKLLDSANAQTKQDMSEIQSLFECIDQNPLQLPQLKRQQNDEDDLDPSSQYHQDIFSLQATSTYMYHKIFVDCNYSIGKKMIKVVGDARDQIHQNSIQNALFIVGEINQITNDMLKNFNCTRKQLLQILCHCRKTVEDYYHDRKFILKSKDQVEYERGSIQTEIAQKIPQTIKSFYRLINEVNSQKIITNLFLVSYVFKVECQILKIDKSQRISLAKRIGNTFMKEIQNKVKILDLWGYPHLLYQRYIDDFTC